MSLSAGDDAHSMSFFTLREGSVWALPALHYTMESAMEVRKAFLALQPDCVAVELPETIQLEALHAASRLPDLGAIQIDDLYYLCEPCDPAFEGLRSALEAGKSGFCIDLDVKNYPFFQDLIPDPYSILHIGLEKYYDSFQRATEFSPKSQLDCFRELHMARRLKELSLSYDRILFIGGMSHISSVLKLMALSRFDTPPSVERSKRQLVTLTEESSREVMAECGWISAAYEEWRQNAGAPPLDRQQLILSLYKMAAQHYEENTGHLFRGYHLRNTMKFARNCALIHQHLMPNLFEILTAAKGCVDHNYAYETWLLSTHYPYLKNIDNLPPLPLKVEEIWGHPKKILFHLKEKQRKGNEFQKRKKDSPHTPWKAPSPFSICSYPPEDQIIEKFGDFLKKKGRFLVSEENAKVIPFTTSLEEGIDTRETIRHFHTGKLYVKAKGRPPGPAGSVVIIFDEDLDEENRFFEEKFPWLATWHGEHQQESDMAFYASSLKKQIVGPGISRCEYGGLMMSYPPRRMGDVWRDPDYTSCRSKAELLLMAAIDYSLQLIVVYVSEKGPRSKMKSFAARFGKKIVYLPIGQLSPLLLNKLRVFHVLDGHDKREIAGEYIF